MFALVNIHDEVIIVVTLDGRFFRPKEVGLVVWVYGRAATGARIFFHKSY